jgi:hypothetical protein
MQGAELQAISDQLGWRALGPQGAHDDAIQPGLIRIYLATLIIVVPLDFLFLGFIAKGLFRLGREPSERTRNPETIDTGFRGRAGARPGFTNAGLRLYFGCGTIRI